MKQTYSKTGRVCRVTFEVQPNVTAHTVSLPAGQQYQYAICWTASVGSMTLIPMPPPQPVWQ